MVNNQLGWIHLASHLTTISPIPTTINPSVPYKYQQVSLFSLCFS